MPAGAKKPAINLPISYLLWALLAIVLLIAWARWQGWTWSQPDAPVLWQRELVFQDTPDGQVAVLDYPSGEEVARFEGEQGFLRGTLRVLARKRKQNGLGPQAPFAVIAHTDGRLTLLDPSVGTRIDLESFGAGNAAIFRQLKDPQPSPRSMNNVADTQATTRPTPCRETAAASPAQQSQSESASRQALDLGLSC